MYKYWLILILSFPVIASDDDDDGDVGPQGPQGTNGATGAQGAAGTNGVDGSNGAKGDAGAQGLNGDAGTNGVDGAQGIAGTNGSKGNTGLNGKDGINGKDGANGTSYGVASAIAASQLNFDYGTTSWQWSASMGAFDASTAFSFGLAKKVNGILINSSITQEDGKTGGGIGVSGRF